MTRDPKDDFLVVYAVGGEADHLITGSEDLRVLKQAAQVTMATPDGFMRKIRVDEVFIPPGSPVHRQTQ